MSTAEMKLRTTKQTESYFRRMTALERAGRLNDAAAASLLRLSASPMDAIAKLQHK